MTLLLVQSLALGIPLNGAEVRTGVAPSFLTFSAAQRHQIIGTVSGDHLHRTWCRVIPRCCSHTSNVVDWLRPWRVHLDILIQKDASTITIAAHRLALRTRRLLTYLCCVLIKEIQAPCGSCHSAPALACM